MCITTTALILDKQHGFTAVLNYEASLCVLGYCFSCQVVSIRTKILILKVATVKLIISCTYGM